MVAQRAAEQKERRQREQIGVHDPLHLLSARAVAFADRRQCDAKYRSFDERQAGGEDAGYQRPVRMTLRTRPLAGPRAHAVAFASSIATSTIRCQISGSPTAAIARSGSRIVCSTAMASSRCSGQTRSTFSAAEGSLPSALLLC